MRIFDAPPDTQVAQTLSDKLGNAGPARTLEFLGDEAADEPKTVLDGYLREMEALNKAKELEKTKATQPKGLSAIKLDITQMSAGMSSAIQSAGDEPGEAPSPERRVRSHHRINAFFRPLKRSVVT